MSDADLPPPSDALPDLRLYVPHFEGWTAKIKTNWDKDYCYCKLPGEDFFHLILCGEIYLENAEERMCLSCARRRGIATDDRLYWQRGVRRAPPPPL